MGKVETEETFALAEEVEGELLDVALVDHQHENAVERVLSEVLGNSVVEEPVKEQKQQ